MADGLSGGSFFDLPLQALKVDDQGDAVRSVQLLLIGADIDLPIYGADGLFGEETEEAVKEFQSERDIFPSGVVDEETYSALLGY